MLCPNCGQMNIGNSPTCSNCGHPLTDPDTQSWQQTDTGAPAGQTYNTPDNVGIPPWTGNAPSGPEQPYYGSQPENQWNQQYPNQPKYSQQYANQGQPGYQGGQFIPPPPPGQFPYPPVPTKPGKGKKIAVIVIVVVLILLLLLGAVGIGGYFFLTKSTSGPSITDSSSNDQAALYLDNVKTGFMDEYPDVEIGYAFDNFFTDPEWNYAMEDGWHKVIFTGGCLYDGANVDTEIHFVFDGPITQNSSSFTIKELKVNGDAMDDAALDSLLNEIFSSTASDPTSDIQEDEINLEEGSDDQLF